MKKALLLSFLRTASTLLAEAKEEITPNLNPEAIEKKKIQFSNNEYNYIACFDKLDDLEQKLNDLEDFLNG